VTSSSQILDASPIPADLFRTGLYTIWRSRFRTRAVRLGKRMLFSSRTVTDALERTISIRRTGFVLIGTGDSSSIFVLPGCPARLADIYK
jgi:hypothetical protein